MHLIILDESDYGHCPHCADLLHAFEIVERLLPHDRAPVLRYTHNNMSQDPYLDEPLRDANAVTPLIVYMGHVFHGSGDDYNMNRFYLSRLYSIDI